LLTRQGLVTVKARALRRRVWFQALTRIERGIVDLTIHYVERIRSRVLNRIISEILAKIQKTQKPSFLKMAERIGRTQAALIAALARAWGNTDARRWHRDTSFVTFLGITTVNE
jgi:hypothetical protein